MFEILFSSKAKKDWSKLEVSTRTLFVKVFDDNNFRLNPISNKNHDIKKLSGVDGYRLRIGTYRVVYTVEKEIKIIKIYAIAHRKDIYKF